MNYEDRVTKEYVENALANAGAKVVTGTYTGDGNTTRTIDLGFTPKAVVVYTNNGIQLAASGGWMYGGLALQGYPCIRDMNSTIYNGIEIVTGGFNVAFNVEGYLCTNNPVTVFYYLAIG